MDRPRRASAARSAVQLWTAARRGDYDEVETLIAAGADVDAPNPELKRFTPLILAAEYGHRVVANKLLRAGADPNAATTQVRTCIVRTTRVQLSLDDCLFGASSMHQGNTALHLAAMHGACLCTSCWQLPLRRDLA